MKLAVLTDIHFGARNDSAFFNRRLNDYLHNEFIEYLIQHKIDTMLLLGDIFDRRRFINYVTLSEVKEFFDRIQELKIKVYSILGNHDVYYKSHNELNSQELLLREYKNIRIIRDMEVIDFDGLKIGMLSWICPKTKEEKLKWIKECDARVLCGHLEPANFSHVCGYNYSGPDIALFSRFDFVFSGHHHIKGDDGHFYFLGSPIQFDWGDYGSEKGFHIIDTNTVTHQFIPNTNTIFEKIDYHNDISIMDFDYTPYKDKIVKIMMPDYDTVNKQKMTLFVDSVDSHAHYTELVWPTDQLKIETDVFNEEIQSGDTMGLIRSYITEFIKGEHIDQDFLVQYSLELYREAMERG